MKLQFHTLALSALLAAGCNLALADGGAAPVDAANQAAQTHLVVFTAGAVIPADTRVLKVGGGTGDLVFELLDASGQKPATLPQGVMFGADGVLSGTVPESAVTKFDQVYTVRIHDQGGGGLTRKFSLRINPPLGATIEPIRLTAGGNISMPIIPYKITGGTGTARVTYVNANGAAMDPPSGLRFGPDGGISGKVPTQPGAVEGMKALFLDQGGGRVLKDVVWAINKPLKLTTHNVLLTAGGSLVDPVTVAAVEGGTGSIRYTLLSSSGDRPDLPEGMTFNEVTGTLSGQLHASGPMERKFLVRAVDQGGGSTDGTILLKVNKPIEVLAE